MKEKNVPLECIWSYIHCKILENGFSNVSVCYHEPFARSPYISSFQKLSTRFPETSCNIRFVITGWLKFRVFFCVLAYILFKVKYAACHGPLNFANCWLRMAGKKS